MHEVERKVRQEEKNVSSVVQRTKTSAKQSQRGLKPFEFTTLSTRVSHVPSELRHMVQRKLADIRADTGYFASTERSTYYGVESRVTGTETGKRVAIIQRMKDNVVQRCKDDTESTVATSKEPDPSGSGGGTPSDELDWDWDSGVDRKKHVELHENQDESKKKHGVFYGKAVATINDAWKKRGSGTKVTEGNSDKYTIPYEDAGYPGGEDGKFLYKKFQYVIIITQTGTYKIITGYPGDTK